MSESPLRRIPFRVDMAGVIEIMGRSLYSDRATPIRELVQNAHDSIRRRRADELDFVGTIRIVPDAGARTLRFVDDGVGLDEDEAERYLGTVGMSLTGSIRSAHGASAGGAADGLIGQFGIGLLSAFLLADRIEVHSRKDERTPPITWIAGQDADILIGPGTRVERGTDVILHLREDAADFAADEELLESTVRRFAEFLEVPIHIGSAARRANLARASWLEATLDEEDVRRDLALRFDEEPLAVLCVDERSAPRIRGALYVTAERTPGFTSEATVQVTLKRMLISTAVRELVPSWAPFLRGVLELPDCTPTASREDLVRNNAFRAVRERLEHVIHTWFETLGARDDDTWRSICEWHRYTLLGSALGSDRLRATLRSSLRWSTSLGDLRFEEILERSEADPLLGGDADHTIWFNLQRRQEHWIDEVFRRSDAPCVHCLRSFEMSLLSRLVQDANANGANIELLPARLESPGFAESILGVREHGPIDDAWQRFLGVDDARVYTARGDGSLPCLALVDERSDFVQRMGALKEQGRIPSGFRALIEREVGDVEEARSEVLLDLTHPLVGRALDRSVRHPLAHVLRVQVAGALEGAGARLSEAARRDRQADLDWVSEALP